MGHNQAQEGFLGPMNLLKGCAEFCVTMHFFSGKNIHSFHQTLQHEGDFPQS